LQVDDSIEDLFFAIYRFYNCTDKALAYGYIRLEELLASVVTILLFFNSWSILIRFSKKIAISILMSTFFVTKIYKFLITAQHYNTVTAQFVCKQKGEPPNRGCDNGTNNNLWSLKHTMMFFSRSNIRYESLLWSDRVKCVLWHWICNLKSVKNRRKKSSPQGKYRNFDLTCFFKSQFWFDNDNCWHAISNLSQACFGQKSSFVRASRSNKSSVYKAYKTRGINHCNSA